VHWDDLKVLLAVADSGTVSGAARNLVVDSAEVTRRLSALSSSLNCELVARTGDLVAITGSGQRAVGAARAIEAQLAALTEELGGAQGEVTGTLCVTSTPSFVRKAMTAFDGLRDKYPALNVDLMVSSHIVNLHRKEADVAVRMFKDQQDGLAMTKLGTFGWSLYASEKYLAGRTPGANPADGHKVIAYDESFSNTAGGRWIAANVAEEAIAMRVPGIRQALDAAVAHKGVCLVPCYLTGEHNVVRVTDQVLAHNDAYAVYLAVRSNEARIRVVVDTLIDMFAHQHTTFAGIQA
jgi:DNA-binding transcriptional LysR family regulator